MKPFFKVVLGTAILNNMYLLWEKHAGKISLILFSKLIKKIKPINSPFSYHPFILILLHLNALYHQKQRDIFRCEYISVVQHSLLRYFSYSMQALAIYFRLTKYYKIYLLSNLSCNQFFIQITFFLRLKYHSQTNYVKY